MASNLLDNQAIILSAYAAMQQTNDAAFSFHQESNFWWLTGISDPDWWLIIEPTGKASLVRPSISNTHQIFDGSLSAHDAIQTSGVDRVIDRKQAAQLLSQLGKQYNSALTMGQHPYKKHFSFTENPSAARLRTMLKKYFASVEDCRSELAKLRAIKQPHEIDALQRAIDVTAAGFTDIKEKLQNGEVQSEYDIEAEFTYGFTKARHYRHAYDPIIASNKNACTLHYNKNSDVLTDGLVLMDVGARVDGYAADITRTYAIGSVTDRQRQVHAAVESAHHQIISLLRPGLEVKVYQQSVDEIMKSAMKSLGLLNKESDYRTYFPHAISHGLGVDVHDSLGGPTQFQTGMVLTVEPGMYIPEEGIGVRIEDDILITVDGHRNLSGHLPTGL